MLSLALNCRSSWVLPLQLGPTSRINLLLRSPISPMSRSSFASMLILSVRLSFEPALIRGAVARCQYGIVHTIQGQVIPQPQPVFLTPQLMLWRTIDAPFTQCVTCCGGAQFELQSAILHAVVQFGDLRSWLVRMRHQLQLHDARPLNILVGAFMCSHLAARQQLR